MFEILSQPDVRPMVVAFGSAIVTLALVSIPFVTGASGSADLANPYYAFAVVAIAACAVVSGGWLAANALR